MHLESHSLTVEELSHLQWLSKPPTMVRYHPFFFYQSLTFFAPVLPLTVISLTFLLDHSHHSDMSHIFKITKYVDKIDPLPWFLSILPAIISFHSLTMEQNFLKVLSVHAVSYFSSTINSSTHHNLAFVPNPLLKLFLSDLAKFLCCQFYGHFSSHMVLDLLFDIVTMPFALKHLCSLTCPTPDPAISCCWRTSFPIWNQQRSMKTSASLVIPSWCPLVPLSGRVLWSLELSSRNIFPAI